MAGRKVFQPATVLTAADVNDYLMDQAVMVFANSAARASAIGTPTAGMVSYLQDSSSLQVYGTAWANVSNPGDITAVTAGTGLTGGGTSGDVTLNVNYAQVIPTSIVTATGDLIVANGNASVTRLGIGSNGQALLSNGTTAVWGTPSTTPTYESWTQLASGSFPAANQLALSSFPAKDNYFLILYSGSINSATASTITVRLNGDSSNHIAQAANIKAPSAYGTTIVSNYFLSGDGPKLAQTATNAASVFNGSIFIRGARKTGGSPAFYDFSGSASNGGGNSHEAFIGQGYYEGASAVNSLVVKISGTANFDDGSYVLWGSD